MGIQEYILAGSKLPIHNHYQLRLTKLESQQPGVDISVLKFSGTEALSEILRYEIEFTSRVKDIPAQHIINYSALFLMYPDGKPYESVKPRILPGVITHFRQCGTSADETRYVATLEHRLTRLNQGTNNAIYQNDSVISMTENTFLRYNMDRLDFRFALNDQYPLKKFMMQFGESEYAHIARRLADSGISYFFEYDEENNCDVMVLADHSYAWPETLAIPFRNPAGLFDGGLESVWDMSVSRKSIPKTVMVNDDYFAAAQSDMKAVAATNPDYPALVAEDYRWGENYPEAGKEFSNQPGQGMWYAKRRQERYLTEHITFEGKSNCMTLRPGMVITTPGKEWPEAKDGLLIVSTSSKNVARDTAYFVTFTAVPRNTQHPFRPALLPWPVVTGTLPARISSAHPDEPYAHINADGLYRAQFGFDRAVWLHVTHHVTQRRGAVMNWQRPEMVRHAVPRLPAWWWWLPAQGRHDLSLLLGPKSPASFWLALCLAAQGGDLGQRGQLVAAQTDEAISLIQLSTQPAAPVTAPHDTLSR